MWAGIVFADVLAHYTAAELPLAFVTLRVGKEIHESLVMVGKANHQIIIHAAVMLDAILLKVNLLAAGG